MKNKNSRDDERVAIVTGSDRGIGFEVCRELGARGYQVVLTSPDLVKGQKAATKLQGQGLAVVYHVLDLLNERHLRTLQAFILKKFGRVDVLVNNAGVMLDGGRSQREGILVRRVKSVSRKLDFGEAPGILDVGGDIVLGTLEVNLLGALRMCQSFVPMMIKAGYGRVINVSSRLGQLHTMSDAEKVPAYQISKTALNAVTRLVADAAGGTNVLVNSVCPGWTRTAIGGPRAPQSTEDAARTILWLATHPDGGPTGSFFYNKKRMDW